MTCEFSVPVVKAFGACVCVCLLCTNTEIRSRRKSQPQRWTKRQMIFLCVCVFRRSVQLSSLSVVCWDLLYKIKWICVHILCRPIVDRHFYKLNTLNFVVHVAWIGCSKIGFFTYYWSRCCRTNYQLGRFFCRNNKNIISGKIDSRIIFSKFSNWDALSFLTVSQGSYFEKWIYDLNWEMSGSLRFNTFPRKYSSRDLV